MSQSERTPMISQELTEELAETAATLTRLGITLAGVPAALLPRAQREQVRQVTEEVFRLGAALPRTVTRMLQETQEAGDSGPREDLGSRLRRERRDQERAARAQSGEESLPDESEATEEVEEELQDAWNDPPLEPGEQEGQPAAAPDSPSSR